MGAGQWKVFRKAKKKIGNGTISLAATTYRMALVKTVGATASALAPVSLFGSLTEVTAANGYSQYGKTLASEIWTVSSGGTQGTYMFDVADKTWTASGGNITSVKAAVIYVSAATATGRQLLCYSTLTTTGAITINNGNSMTVQIASTGVFTMA